LWHICSKQELWSQRNSCCYRTALKQHSFLGNGSIKDMDATIEVPLETKLSTRSVLRGYKDDKWSNRVSSVGWEPPFREDFSVWRKISTVKSRCQGTVGETSRLEKI
jgi:hypothetical protein